MTKELDERIKKLDQLRRTAAEKRNGHQLLTKEEKEIINVPKKYKGDEQKNSIHIPIPWICN